MNNPESSSRSGSASAPAEKRAYKTPVLVQHGTLREITLNVGSKGKKPDTGGGKNNKTR